MGLIALSGCATAPSSTVSESAPDWAQSGAVASAPQMVPARYAGTGSGSSSGTSGSSKAPLIRTEKNEIIVRGVKLQNTRFDYPVVINTQVEKWVDYFLGRGRKHFERYLERSELFIPYIQPLLRQQGLPEDLVYLAMIESGFNNHARSHAKAVGPWQFISATGKRYGLAVNWWVDERRDTRKSTLAAAEYLKDLYTMFQSWELAAAAYNAGESKIARAIQRFGTKDFWALTRQRYLRSETRNYVPKIMAAAIVAKNRTQFGFPASAIHPGQGEVIASDGEVVKIKRSAEEKASPEESAETLASLLQEEEERLADDTEAAEVLPTVVQQSGAVAVAVARPVPTPQVNRKGELSGEALTEIEVQSPADLLKIAQAADLSYATVKALNADILRWCTPPQASTYRLKIPTESKERFLATYNHPEFERKVSFMAYKARSGDSIQRIARHFGIHVDPVKDLNRVGPQTSLRAGTRVLLPMPNDRSRTLATLDVRDPAERRRSRRAKKAPKYEHRVSAKKRQSARPSSSGLRV